MNPGRRDLLVAGLAIAASRLRRQASGPQAPSRGTNTLAAPLHDPEMAGNPRNQVTASDNDPAIVGIERQLRCTGGCNLSVYTCRTTDFTCKVSPAMHARVVTAIASGRTEPQVLEDFVAEYGQTVLMAPPRRGFNLAAYFVPGALIATVAGGMLWTLRRRAAEATAARASSPSPAAPTARLSDDARLEAELKSLDR